MIEAFPSRTVAISVFGYAVHWYGVMYALAFWVAYALLPHLGRLRGMQRTRDEWTLLIVYVALGVLVGGRLGYALLYEPAYFLSHPLHVFALWGGGMSSHGGFIGVAIALWMYAKAHRMSLIALFDIATVPAAIGLALGRIGNFINQELYVGHDALIDVFCMFGISVVCYAMLRRRATSGSVIALFLILYSITRFFLEYIRVQEWSYVFGLTRGQFFTIPLLVIGMLLLVHVLRKRK